MKTEPQALINIRTTQAGDVGWILQKHGEIFVNEFGWDVDQLESYVMGLLSEFVQNRNKPGSKYNGWIAELNGIPVGCILCFQKDEDTAQIRLLLVTSEGRNHGVGTELIQTCLSFSKEVGYKKMFLFTTSVQTIAHRIYEKLGFKLVKRYGIKDFAENMEGFEYELNNLSL